jgi:hypothetical protein
MNNPKTRDDDERSSVANQGGTEKEARRVVEGGEADQNAQREGDNRTSDKTIGQIKYADKLEEKKSPGGAGNPQTSKMEPEKQGGIGGP